MSRRPNADSSDESKISSTQLDPKSVRWVCTRTSIEDPMSLQLATLVEEFSILPEQDSATMRLLSLLDDPNVEGRDIARVIEADPSMTARLLTLANSAFFAVKNPVTNPWGAVMVVGFNVVRALAASGSLGLGDPAGEMPDGFFEHSIASAAGAAVAVGANWWRKG